MYVHDSPLDMLRPDSRAGSGAIGPPTPARCGLAFGKGIIMGANFTMNQAANFT